MQDALPSCDRTTHTIGQLMPTNSHDDVEPTGCDIAQCMSYMYGANRLGYVGSTSPTRRKLLQLKRTPTHKETGYDSQVVYHYCYVNACYI